MNLRKHLHDKLGSMYVMEDHNGVWFKFTNVICCLGINVNVAAEIYDSLPDIFKEKKHCMLNCGNEGDFMFIHEDAIYGFIAKCKNKDFQEWFRDIMEMTKGTGDLVDAKTIIAIDNELKHITLKHLLHVKMRTKCDKK